MDPPKFEFGDKVWLLKGIKEKNKKKKLIMKKKFQKELTT